LSVAVQYPRSVFASTRLTIIIAITGIYATDFEDKGAIASH